ncbi:MAG: type I-B CRISPR-associated protein Cas8b1/Cst1 [Syntrophaceticus sp.]|nr:type I-B CRISPR-associated protein Cas8b1/Cst1 [Paludibacter sp.]MDD4360054.1 type I-B CRISPR-associated protein Cas8b1/Cst1 [Syntrophaceticus sp.]MDD4428964.1 type I-B CRISPR-associated protein Cas8b1/Cst1 [Paludibacter sp.]
MSDVVIYPSTWYYNACVQGFLETLAWGLGEDGQQQVEEMLKDDGRVVIQYKLMEAVFSTNDRPSPIGYTLKDSKIPDLKRIGWWWVEKSKKSSGNNPEDDMNSTCLSLFGTNKTFYPCLLTHNDKMNRADFLNSWFVWESSGKFHCSFCNSLCQLDETMKDKYNYFSRELSKLLGSTKDGFPNSFWNITPDLLICKHCRSYFLFFHIAHQNRFFINSDSLKVNWHLNHLLSVQINKQRDWQQQTLMNAVHYDPQLRRTLGNWGLQNLEVVIFNRGEVNCYPISANLAKLLLIPSISSLISKISNRTVWDIVLKERFDYLLTIIYKSLHVFLADKDKDTEKDPEIIKIWGSGSNRNITPITNIIELYQEIRKNQEGGNKVSDINFYALRKEASQAPIDLGDNRGKNLVFRLLELTRMNKKSSVYHLLLRVYIARGIEFPNQLSRLFQIEDSELFKNGIYAFISNLKNSKKNNIEKSS